MSKYTIGCDLDGTGYNFVDRLRKFINMHSGKPIREMPPAKSWNFFSDQWGLTLAEYNEFLMEGVRQDYIFRYGDPIKGFKEALDYFHNVREDRIVIITSRKIVGLEDACMLATKTWLDEQEIAYDDIILTDNKLEVDFDILIDDGPHHIEEVILQGKEAIIFDQMWNRALTSPRGKGWPEIIEYVNKVLPVNSEEILIPS